MGNALTVINDVPIGCYVSVHTAGKVFLIGQQGVGPNDRIKFDLERVWYDVKFEFADGCTGWKTVFMGTTTSVTTSSIHPVSSLHEQGIFTSSSHQTYLQALEDFGPEAAFGSTAGDVLTAAVLALYKAAGGKADDPLWKVVAWILASGILILEEEKKVETNDVGGGKGNYCEECKHFCKHKGKFYCIVCDHHHKHRA